LGRSRLSAYQPQRAWRSLALCPGSSGWKTSLALLNFAVASIILVCLLSPQVSFRYPRQNRVPHSMHSRNWCSPLESSSGTAPTFSCLQPEFRIPSWRLRYDFGISIAHPHRCRQTRCWCFAPPAYYRAECSSLSPKYAGSECVQELVRFIVRLPRSFPDQTSRT